MIKLKNQIASFSLARRLLLAVQIGLFLFTLWFIFSHSMASVAVSSAESQTWFGVLQPYLDPVFGDEVVTEPILRKVAHVTEFGLLGVQTVLLAIPFFPYRKILLPSLFFGMTTALTDETVQIVSKRGSMVADVWLDFAGFGTAVLLCGVFLLILTLFQSKNN